MSLKTKLDSQRLLQHAVARLRQGKFAKSKAAFARVLAEHPRHADALHFMGLAEYQAGDRQGAIRRLEASVSIKPGQPIAWNNLANMYAAVGRNEDAVRAYHQATKLNPKYADAHRNLASTWVQMGQTDKAADSFRRVLAVRPNDAPSHLGLARVLEQRQDWNAAVVSYRRALRHCPRYGVAYSRLGSLLRQLGRPDEARGVCEQWLRQEPDNPRAKQMLANIDSQNSADD